MSTFTMVLVVLVLGWAFWRFVWLPKHPGSFSVDSPPATSPNIPNAGNVASINA